MFTESKFAVAYFRKYLIGILCERESDFLLPFCSQHLLRVRTVTKYCKTVWDFWYSNSVWLFLNNLNRHHLALVLLKHHYLLYRRAYTCHRQFVHRRHHLNNIYLVGIHCLLGSKITVDPLKSVAFITTYLPSYLLSGLLWSLLKISSFVCVFAESKCFECSYTQMARGTWQSEERNREDWVEYIKK